MNKKTFPTRTHDSIGLDNSKIWNDPKTKKIQFIERPDGKKLWADYEFISNGFVWRDIHTNRIVEN